VTPSAIAQDGERDDRELAGRGAGLPGCSRFYGHAGTDDKPGQVGNVPYVSRLEAGITHKIFSVNHLFAPGPSSHSSAFSAPAGFSPRPDRKA
jgi:hypothetical protein